MTAEDRLPVKRLRTASPVPHENDRPTPKRSKYLPPVLAVVSFSLLAVFAYWPVSPLSQTQLPVCACGDQLQEVWFLAWTAHALSHAANPFFTNYINYPYGVNLATNTSMPLVGLLAAPITWLHGPVASFNFMLRFSFAASASSMLFVVRRFTRRWAPAFLGGLLYGFSPYMIGQGLGHLFLTFVPLPPLLALAIYELCRERQTRTKTWAVVLGILGAMQFFISAEVLVSTLLCCAAGLLFSFAMDHRLLARTGSILKEAWLAAAIFVPLVAYPTYLVFYGAQHVVGPPRPVAQLAIYRADLLGTIVPTLSQLIGPSRLVALGSSFAAGNLSENGAYLGIPLIVLVLALIYRYRRERLIIIGALVGAFAYVLTLGARLTVDNHVTAIPLPFALLTKVPIVQDLVPLRFSLYVQASAAVILAVGIDRLLIGGVGSLPRRFLESHVRWRAVISPLRALWLRNARVRLHLPRIDQPRFRQHLFAGIIAIVALLPVVPRLPFSSSSTDVPKYFVAQLAKAIPAGSTVLTYPYDISPNNEGMLWQSITDMTFRMVGGEATTPGVRGTGTTAVRTLPPIELQNLFRAGMLGSASPVHAPPLDHLGIARVRRFLARWHIRTIVVDPIGDNPALVVHYLTVALRRPPLAIGGVLVWYDIGARS